MTAETHAILKLEVPVIVVLGERLMSIQDLLAIAPGGIIEIPKNADAELELRINNRTIGRGRAVKVGENFGLRLSSIGHTAAKVESNPQQMAAQQSEADAELDAAAMAEAMMSGQ